MLLLQWPVQCSIPETEPQAFPGQCPSIVTYSLRSLLGHCPLEKQSNSEYLDFNDLQGATSSMNTKEYVCVSFSLKEWNFSDVTFQALWGKGNQGAVCVAGRTFQHLWIITPLLHERLALKMSIYAWTLQTNTSYKYESCQNPELVQTLCQPLSAFLTEE